MPGICLANATNRQYMTIDFPEEPERPLVIYYPEPVLIAWSPKYHNRILAPAVWRPISSFMGQNILFPWHSYLIEGNLQRIHLYYIILWRAIVTKFSLN